MQDIRKKKVETEWRRLITRTDKSVKTKPFINPSCAKVIRRRKGKKDLFIEATPAASDKRVVT